MCFAVIPHRYNNNNSYLQLTNEIKAFIGLIKFVSIFHFIFVCVECSACKENWLCLHCGGVHCGRYENGHALAHSKSRAHHSICINTLNGSVFCYQCDDFVINDTGRKILQTLRRELEQQYDETAGSTDRSSSNRLSTTSTNVDDDTATTRVLRPRKRTVSSDSTEPKIEAPKRKILKKGTASTAATSGTSATVSKQNVPTDGIHLSPQLELPFECL